MTPGAWMVCCLVAAASSKVVHQADGIISIITELEPERIPVSYAQVVGRASGGDSAPEDNKDRLEEGAFRVKSAKIKIVDPDTGFEVVHHAEVSDNKEEIPRAGNDTDQGERRIARQPDAASSYRVVYPSVIPEYFSDNKENSYRNTLPRRRKEGKYGYQVPRRDNTVRTEQTTRIRNNNEPAKVYKHTIVRPVTQDDEVKQRGKYGKAGRYGKHAREGVPIPISSDTGDSVGSTIGRERLSSRSKVGRPGRYSSRQPVINRNPGIGEVIDGSEEGTEYLSPNDPSRRKTEKEFSSKTVVKFPDGYAHDNEKRVESSSKYRTGSRYRTPTVKTSRNHQHRIVGNKTPEKDTIFGGNLELDKAPSTKKVIRKFDGKDVPDIGSSGKVELDQPLQEAGSVLTSGVIGGIDDGLTEDSGLIYAGGGYGGGFDKEKHFEKEKGKEYVAAHNSAHGDKSEKGYDKKEAFSKGENEKHGHEENKAYAVEKEGDKKSHLDKSSHFAAGQKASEGEKASDYHKEKGHRKGHKKSGFRTVHHKDEFKKNEEFYDEEHDSGDQHVHGHKSQQHAEKAGGHDKKAYLDSGHHQSSRGHEGGHENGNAYNHHKGHSQEKGHSGHYGHDQEYGKKSGFKEGEEHGHSEYGGHKHY